MKPIDIVIIVLAIAVVAGVVAYSVWKKKTGKGGCGCGCDGCGASCNGCPSAKKEEKDKDV